MDDDRHVGFPDHDQSISRMDCLRGLDSTLNLRTDSYLGYPEISPDDPTVDQKSCTDSPDSIPGWNREKSSSNLHMSAVQK